MTVRDGVVIEAWADALWAAEQTRTAIEPITGQAGELGPDDAYAIQLAVAARRRALGQRVIGKKIGLTSTAMQAMFGVEEPDYGHLFDVMVVPSGGEVSCAELIQPKIEPELAFVLARPLSGADVSPADVIAATDRVTASLEIVDSRIADWRIRWADTVADNGSSARVVLAEGGVPLQGLDLPGTGVVLERNGEIVAEATLAEVLGSPLHAICWLVRKLDHFGIGLAAGDVILPGSPCRAPDARPGDSFAAHITDVGSVQVRFV